MVPWSQFGIALHKSLPAVYSLQQRPSPLIPAFSSPGAMNVGILRAGGPLGASVSIWGPEVIS